MRGRIVRLAGRRGVRGDRASARHRIARSVAVVGALTTVFVSVPALASAATWCVSPATSCDSTHLVADVQTALNDASANPGPDTVVLGATTYSTNGYTYAGDSTNPLTIEGAGPPLTLLATTAAGQTLLTASGGPSVAVENLTAALDGGPNVSKASAKIASADGAGQLASKTVTIMLKPSRPARH